MYRLSLEESVSAVMGELEGISDYSLISEKEIYWLSNSSVFYHLDFDLYEMNEVEPFSWIEDQGSPVVMNPFTRAVRMINGKIIPKSDYQEGSKYTGSDNGAIQCMGFAYHIYNYLFTGYGTIVEANKEWKLGDDAAKAAAVEASLKNVCVGTNMRVRDYDGNANPPGHSVIIASIDNVNKKLVIYDANADGANTVRLVEYTYTAFANQYLRCMRYRSPEHKAMLSDGASGHRQCGAAGCIKYNTIEPHYSSAPGPNAKCNACGFVGNITIGIAPNSTGDPIDKADHQIVEN